MALLASHFAHFVVLIFEGFFELFLTQLWNNGPLEHSF